MTGENQCGECRHVMNFPRSGTPEILSDVQFLMQIGKTEFV